MTIPNGDTFFTPPSCLPCTPEEEKDVITDLITFADANIKEGDTFYLLTTSWWMQWCRYVGLDDTPNTESSEEPLSCCPRPGEIDNSYLIYSGTNMEDDELELQINLQEGQDYTLVPEEVWKRLLEWYAGGPELPRKVISQGTNAKKFNVEVYPLRLQLINAKDNSRKVIKISKMASVRELYQIVCTLSDIEEEKADIWDYYGDTKSKLLTEFDQSLEDAHLIMDQEILLELKDDILTSTTRSGNELALVPLEPARSSMTIAGGPTFSNSYSSGLGYNFQQGSTLSLFRDAEEGDDYTSVGVKVDGQGLTGLHNLGNTCFMNSAIQCLVHTPPLVDFFLEDYTEEINKGNPLGMQGELAIAFGQLLRKLWTSGRTSVAPREFKAKLARFAPQFSGYNQHDSQELLAFLLDGLHEDLNRVKNKPYIECKDSNGRPDEEFAEECWRNHKARNDSVIVDVCQGQYKSTLVCPVCRRVSVTFDPFMYLSLPLPSNIIRTMNATVFSGDGTALPIPYTMTVPKNGTVKDLLRALSAAACVKDTETLLLAEVYDQRIHRYLEKYHEPLSSIRDDDHIVAYRLPINHHSFQRIEIFHRRPDKFLAESYYHNRFYGTPLVTCLPKDSTTADIESSVRTLLVPLLRAKNISRPKHNTYDDVNGGETCMDDTVLRDNTVPCLNDYSSTSNGGLEQAANGYPSFHLSLSVENYAAANAQTIRYFVDWSDKENELYDFSFLENLPEVFKPGFMSKKTRQESVTLYSCLDAFIKEEPLGPDDMWYCPSCKEHRQATKKLDLWKLPDILVVHLKRFSYSRFMKNKLDTFVNFPIHNLDLSKYVKDTINTPEANLYELYAVSNHYGGLGGGHYSAYAKLIDEESWHHFDDSHVSPVREDDVRTAAAYVLFYRRVKPGSGKHMDESSASNNMEI